MIFLNPWGFLGFFSLPVIILLHLFRERKKRLVVSNLEMWSFLDIEVRGSQPRRLPITLILLLQLLLAVLFSLALAQPRLLLETPVQNAKHHVLLLDASMSMSSLDVPPSRFSRAAAGAVGILSSLGDEDTATVIKFGTTVEIIGEAARSGLPELIGLLDSLQPDERDSDLEAALALGVSTTTGKRNVEFHIFSDGAYPEPRISNFPYPIQWHWFGESDNNQAVMEVVPLTDKQGMTHVFTRLANFSAATRSQLVVLYFDGSPVDSSTVSIPAQSTIKQSWRVSGTPSLVTVGFASYDNLPSDDTASAGMFQRSKPSVLIVSDDPGAVLQAVKAVPDAAYRVQTPDKYSPLEEADLTIFVNYLPDNPAKGVNFIIEPPRDYGGDRPWAPAIEGSVKIPVQESVPVISPDSLVSGLELNSVIWKSIFKIKHAPDDYETIIEVDDHPLLIRKQTGNGSVVILLDDLSTGNFTNHPAFPVFISNLVQSTREFQISSLSTGDPLLLPSPDTYRSVSLSMPDGQEIVMNKDWPRTWKDTSAPGIYHFSAVDTDGKVFTYDVGINASDWQESDIGRQVWEPPTGQAGESTAEDARQSIDLVPWILGVALLLLFIEAILAWR
jgi:Ca-activated chloride channel homolog